MSSNYDRLRLKLYYESHKQERKVAMRKYQQTHKEQINAYQRAWHKEHPEKHHEYYINHVLKERKNETNQQERDKRH